MVDIVNAAPMVIDLGTQDLSTRVVPTNPLELPQHLPKFYIFAEKGPVGPTYVDLDNITLTKLYGVKTFDVNSKYYTHQTLFLQAVSSAGNNCVVHRLIAPNATDVANLALYLDVLPTQVSVYKKNVDGSLKLDSNGDPVPELDNSGNPILVSGFKVKWVLDKTVAAVGTYQRGLLTTRVGTQTDGVNQSTQYPIFEFAAKDPGEFGNSLAVRLYPAYKTDITPFPDKILVEGKMYPFYFQLYRVVDEITGKLSPVLNKFGAQYAKFVAKSGGIDPASGSVIDLEKVIKDQYIELPEALETGLGSVYIYTSNLETLLQQFYDAEKVISDIYRDSEINNTENNIYAFNFISFTSSNGSPYQTTKLVDDIDSVRLTKNTNLFLSGGNDGTLSETLLDSLVKADMERYADPLDEYQDLVVHPESIIYDSGFTLDTKKALMKFISQRKDTCVVLSTFAHDAPSPTLADQYSVGVMLKTMIELYPESATFGTPVMRGMVMAGSGELINSPYTKRVSTAYEVAYKSARYMGARNGSWKNGFCFDKAPLSILTNLKNIDVTWVPPTTRNVLWSVGINFVLNYKIRTQYFPALKTVYENDTSVLNSFFTVMAICYLHKVAHAAHREFSGTISYTNSQLVEKVNEFVRKHASSDKFDNKFVIRPNCTVTEEDAARGYSFTLPIQIYAPNMKTVMTTYVQAFRLEDLQD